MRREALEQYLARDREKVARLARELLYEEMPPITEELFGLYEKNGNRLQYEQVYFTRRKFLAVYAMEALLEGGAPAAGRPRPEIVAKLEEVCGQICGEECWELPAHVDRRDDPDWRVTAALFACETAQTLAFVCHALEGVLRPALAERMRTEIHRRVLEPFFKSRYPYRNWEDCHHNWAAVCGGAIGSALLYLHPEEIAVQGGKLDRVYRVMQSYLAGFKEDGACMEGMGYYGYGMTYFVGLCAQVEEMSGGRIDWLKGEHIHQIALFPQKCYLAGGRTVPFSDGSCEERYKLGVMCYLAGRFADVELPPLSLAAEFDTDSCFRFQAVWMDYFLTKRYLESLGGGAGGAEGEEERLGGARGRQQVLPAAQWSICESARGVAYALKGGCNDEPHNHNDVGAFCLFAEGEMLLADLGAGEYTKDYFNDRRYTIFCNQSLSHNVPVVDGKGQEAGAAYRADAFETDGGGMTRVSFAGAYADGALARLERTLRLDLEGGGLRLEDTFEWRAADGARCVAEENFVSLFPMEIGADRLIVRGERFTLTLASGAIRGGANAYVQKRLHSDHSGCPVQVYVVRIRLADGARKFTAQLSVSGAGDSPRGC